MEEVPTVRRAARVIMLDDNDRVLLARFEYGGKHWWTAPGGGLDDGETHEQAARREVAEETDCLLTNSGPGCGLASTCSTSRAGSTTRWTQEE
jgi:8-oxo-dGTP pyrophosphatase MutT (NUDIX family)